MKSSDEQLERLEQGCETIVTRDELRQKLARGGALRVKLGCDPTAPDLHLGHSVVLRKLRQFQDLGHTAVLIIGDYTALIGDPTGQNKTRPILTAAEIEGNARTYFEQAGKILDTAKLEIRYNSEWLSHLRLGGVIRLASKMTVARMLERDTFAKRYKGGDPIGTHEFLYPLLQGYDSVVVEADVELGGTDQLFNNLVGRELLRDEGREPQIVMILPILEGLDGVEKMSKSKGNYIGLSESPKEMFGKTMSITDALMAKWYQLLLGRSVPVGHPMEAKKTLARTLIEQYHGAAAARLAQEEFEQQFSRRELAAVARLLPIDVREIWIVELVEKAHPKSRSEIRRLIQQGGVSLAGQKITDDKARVQVQDGQILKVGKLIAVRLEVH